MIILFAAILVFFTIYSNAGQSLAGKRNFADIDQLLSLGNHETSLLIPFNRTRAPGTEGSLETQNYIENFFSGLPTKWNFEKDSFVEQGHNFSNLVFSLAQPNTYSDDTFAEIVDVYGVQDEKSFIVLAAHYDSKKDPEGFVGAIDSAASCSIMMYIAYYLSQQIKNSPLAIPSYGIKIVFFDGEEAIHEWSETDSIYGARHLAKKWDQEGIIADAELFILMDLLGGIKQGLKETKVYNFFDESTNQYNLLAKIELQVNEQENIKKQYLEPDVTSFLEYHRDKTHGIIIEDDHKPFYQLGVPVLHLIPFPFPEYWHTIDDDFEHLDIISIKKWAKMLSIYLETLLFDSEIRI